MSISYCGWTELVLLLLILKAIDYCLVAGLMCLSFLLVKHILRCALLKEWVYYGFFIDQISALEFQP